MIVVKRSYLILSSALGVPPTYPFSSSFWDKSHFILYIYEQEEKVRPVLRVIEVSKTELSAREHRAKPIRSDDNRDKKIER